MLGLLLILLLAPFNVLTLPSSFSFPANQLVLQSVGGPVIETEAAAAPSSAVQLIYQFKGHVALENLAARSNGHLVLTVSNQPIVYDMNPNARNAPPTPLPRIPGVTSLTGIVETAPDVFAVVAGNWSRETFQGTPGSFSIWSVDFNHPQPTVKIIASIPEAAALNGLTTLKGSPDIVLAADSALGAVGRLNVTSGEYSVAIQSPLFANSSIIPIGINGLRTFDGHLYYLNSAQGAYGRVPLNADGSAAGEVEVLARINLPAIYDDFDMDWEGTAWIATHGNMLNEITVEGKQRNITGNGQNIEMTEPTSAQFGRGSKQAENTIYVTTGGNDTVGGQVLAVNICLI
ncbi:hypothetical protein OEA41_010854 [Lepraria neglecta]|uniref:Uncharacterized protein n=1 Tax=Lepraria neglecta TaxID=209136 RepID=A0AAE0DFI4_9LECA|nr:hypothetical protein OEA41_010854 [Lepraria neglecta]